MRFLILLFKCMSLLLIAFWVDLEFFQQKRLRVGSVFKIQTFFELKMINIYDSRVSNTSYGISLVSPSAIAKEEWIRRVFFCKWSNATEFRKHFKLRTFIKIWIEIIKSTPTQFLTSSTPNVLWLRCVRRSLYGLWLN